MLMLMLMLFDFRRFLRARKFDINAAFQQFKDTEEWRKDNKIEALYENIDVESYDEARRMVSLRTVARLDCKQVGFRV